MKLVLLHSPLVGPATWDALAPLLRASGHEVFVPDLTAVMRGAAPYYPKLAAAAAGSAQDAALIVHSGAGALVPDIASLADIRGAIFIDALLPHPGKSWFETAPTDLQTHLRGLARDGRLPPWHRWWPKAVIERLLPDAAMYKLFVDGLDDLPLAYFEERASDIAFQMPSAYLQIGPMNGAEADSAEAQGWPVTRLDLHHLAMLTHPDKMAGEIEWLAARL